MANLNELKASAWQAARFRGHLLARWHKSGSNRYCNHCKNCGRLVAIHTHPLPNEIEIGGELVAVNCEGYSGR